MVCAGDGGGGCWDGDGNQGRGVVEGGKIVCGVSGWEGCRVEKR